NGDSLIATCTHAGSTEYFWQLDGSVTSSSQTFRYLPGPGSHTLKFSYYSCTDCRKDTVITFHVSTNHVAKIDPVDPDFCEGDSIKLVSDTTDGNSWYIGPTLLSNLDTLTVS